MSDMALVASDVERSPGDPAAIGAVVAALHGLAGGLYGRLATTPGNLALSPYSVAVALAMTRNGAAGATADEMDGVLGSTDLAAYNGGLNALTQAVEGLAGSFPRSGDDPAVIALDSANTLFGDRGTPWRDSFLDTLAASYGAGMRVVDWAHDPEAGREAVNTWTADRTHDKIPEILPAGVVDELTRLVLVNALYFKAPWLVEFHDDLTADQPFHRSPGDAVDVPTMLGELRSVGLAQGDGWQAVRLPYFGNTLAMTVVLPDDGRLADVEALVARGDLADVLAAPAPAEIRLRLPRWTFRSDTPLSHVLSELDMPDCLQRRRRLHADDRRRDRPEDRRGAAPDVRRRRRARHRGRRSDGGRHAGHVDAAVHRRHRRPAVPLRHPRRRAPDPAVPRPGGRPVGFLSCRRGVA